MRPQGFLGRNFAHLHHQALEVAPNLNDWSDDDILHVLASRGHDQSGDLILSDRAYERHLAAHPEQEAALIAPAQIPTAYPEQAALALAQGVAGASAAGEFPKLTAVRLIDGEPVQVIVKFSGADGSAAVQRWADLLVCEHLALETLAHRLGIPAARSALHQQQGRTFLEVQRFNRVGAHGRLPLCLLSSVNGAQLGLAGAPGPHWPKPCATKAGWIKRRRSRSASCGGAANLSPIPTCTKATSPSSQG